MEEKSLYPRFLQKCDWLFGLFRICSIVVTLMLLCTIYSHLGWPHKHFFLVVSRQMIRDVRNIVIFGWLLLIACLRFSSVSFSPPLLRRKMINRPCGWNLIWDTCDKGLHIANTAECEITNAEKKKKTAVALAAGYRSLCGFHLKQLFTQFMQPQTLNYARFYTKKLYCDT